MFILWNLLYAAGLPKTLSSYYGTQDHQFMVDVYKINFIVRGYLSVAPIGPKLCVPVNLVGEVHKGPGMCWYDICIFRRQ